MSFYAHKEEVEMGLYPPRALERTMKVQEIIHENQTRSCGHDPKHSQGYRRKTAGQPRNNGHHSSKPSSQLV